MHVSRFYSPDDVASMTTIEVFNVLRRRAGSILAKSGVRRRRAVKYAPDLTRRTRVFGLAIQGFADYGAIILFFRYASS
jgi:hypothetical protein